MSKKLGKDDSIVGKEVIEEEFMVKYSGACKRNKDYTVNCKGDCTSCKVVNAETGKFDIYGFMEQAIPLKLDDKETTEQATPVKLDDKGTTEQKEDISLEQSMENYNYVEVSRNQFDAFLDKYPRKLEQDLYMDMYSFYDFSLNETPCQESQVATIYYGEFRIREDILKEFENG